MDKSKEKVSINTDKMATARRECCVGKESIKLDRAITGTIITLSGLDVKSLQSITEEIENQIVNKEGFKIVTSTSFGKSERVHHNILVNRKVEIDLKAKWKNGRSSISYITDDDHYREIIKYVTC